MNKIFTCTLFALIIFLEAAAAIDPPAVTVAVASKSDQKLRRGEEGVRDAVSREGDRTDTGGGVVGGA